MNITKNTVEDLGVPYIIKSSTNVLKYNVQGKISHFAPKDVEFDEVEDLCYLEEIILHQPEVNETIPLQRLVEVGFEYTIILN